MLPVATAIQRGAPKINEFVLCVRVLCKTRMSFIESFSRLNQDVNYLRTGIKGCSKIRRILAKAASYFRRNVPFIRKVRVLFKSRPM